MSGTGKSTVAATLADVLDATIVRSDVIRKWADGGADTVAVAERYSRAARSAVYAALASEADAALGAGRSVIADATFLRRADRDRLRTVAAHHGVPCVFLETRTDPAQVRERLDARTAENVSDARWETYLAQQREREPFDADEGPIVVDTDGAPDAAAARALRALWVWRAQREAAPVE